MAWLGRDVLIGLPSQYGGARMKEMRKREVGFVMLVVLAILAALWIHHQLEIDVCMDNGGRWDSKIDGCSFVTKSPS